jgi:hypothetical protein
MLPVLPIAAILLVGIGLGAKGKDLLQAAAPRVGRASRPILTATIRQGYLLGREVQQLAESVREDLEDITAEAVVDTKSTNDSARPRGGSNRARSPKKSD